MRWLYVSNKKYINMSCLPDIFQASKSQNLPPCKQAAPFSIHLRSSYFQIKPSPPPSTQSTRKLYVSSDQKRYKSWMDSQRPFRQTKRSSRSFFYKEPVSKQRVIEERGHSCDNINGQQSLQSELEAVSNFNVTKKNSLESMILMQKTMEVLTSEQNKINSQLVSLKVKLNSELQSFSDAFTEQLLTLLKTFRTEKRLTMTENKAINGQIEYLASQIATYDNLAHEIEGHFSQITSQFS